MPSVKEFNPKKFSDLVTYIEKISNKHAAMWFRGCGIGSSPLVPKLYRHPTNKTIADISHLEHDLMIHFRQRSIPFHSRNLQDDWDTLFFMQHYGVPTRLLDWTENPFVALYFAVMSAPIQTNGNFSDAAVWILDPIVWNKHALKHQSYDGGILTPGAEALKGYNPSRTIEDMCNFPVALYGTHNSPRIVAQRGVFMIFGQQVHPMEEVFTSEKFPTDCLMKINIKSNRLREIRQSLLKNGTTESVVFPDLDGLAREIKRTFSFEV
jgi:hypothetical protein